MHEFKPWREGRWSKCNLFNMACSLFNEKKMKPFSTDKSNYSHRTQLPGTKLFFVVKTVNKWWKLSWGDQWFFEVFSPSLNKHSSFPIPFHGHGKKQQLRQEALWPWHPISGNLDCSLEAGSTGWWTNRIQVPEQVPSRPIPAQLCVPLNHHQLGWTGHLAKVIQRAGEVEWGLDSRFYERKCMSSNINNNHRILSK